MILDKSTIGNILCVIRLIVSEDIEKKIQELWNNCKPDWTGKIR